jgi:3'(2'), 5'-bisphosphate nucleotidase
MDWTTLFPAVRLAVELTRRVRQLTLDPSDKSANDPVTIADYGAQAILLRAISRLYPNAAILAEERSEQFLSLVTPDKRTLITKMVSDVIGEAVTERELIGWLDFGGGREERELWTVDPIDGTRGYVAGRRYCVALGIMTDRVPSAGLLACPGYPSTDGRGRLLYTVGSVAYSQPLDGGAPKQILVRQRRDSSQFLPIESTDQREVDHPVVLRVCEQLGIVDAQVQAYDGQDKYATIASGDADFYLRPERPKDRPHYIWDHVPGVAILQAAGGVASDLTGAALDFRHGERLPTLGVIVSSRAAHAQVVDALKAVLASPGLRA